MVGAVVIVGSNESGNVSGELSHNSLACVEVLGRTVLGRTIEELLRGSVDSVAVLASGPFSSAVMGHDKVGFFSTEDLWRKAAEKIATLNAEAVVVLRLGAYVEFDPADMIQFHREQSRPVTRACNGDGCLDLWVIDPSIVAVNQDLWGCLQSEDAATYYVSGYVNLLESPRDMRQLISDGLSSRCHFRPQGSELRPGIWMGPGAQVERTARLVAPIFVGRNSKIADQCLITRGSNIEAHSQVDYGTVIEDSTVLSNTYVGIGLDLSHSIVDGSNLLNLQHGVMLKIADPVVLRPTRDSRMRSGTDVSFLANVELGTMAMSSAPKKEQ
jgi:hypothetical protein